MLPYVNKDGQILDIWTDRHSAYGTTELCDTYFVIKSNNFNVPGVKFLDANKSMSLTYLLTLVF